MPHAAVVAAHAGCAAVHAFFNGEFFLGQRLTVAASWAGLHHCVHLCIRIPQVLGGVADRLVILDDRNQRLLRHFDLQQWLRR
jgi:hypothetical protein